MPRPFREPTDLRQPTPGMWLRGAAVLMVFLITLSLCWNGFVQVAEYEQAVVLQFGEYNRTLPPGLHFVWPYFEEAIPVSVEEHGMRLPFDDRTRNNVPESEMLMLTGTLDAAVVEWTLQWQVVEPEKFLFSVASDQMEPTIKTISKSVMNRLVGNYSLNEIRTEKREEIAAEAQRSMQTQLDTLYDCGVQIKGVQLQKVTPPAMVTPAYDEVNAAIQNKSQLINQANQERNRLLPAAEAARDRLIREAEGFAEKRRAEAQGEISALLATYRAYKDAPEITRQRLYLEAMEEILQRSGPKLIVDSDLQGFLPLLNLNPESAR